MRKRTKAKPITFRLYVDERTRVDRFFNERFKPKYPYAELTDFLRVWLGLDQTVTLSDDERAYLTGRNDVLPNESHDSPTYRKGDPIKVTRR